MAGENVVGESSNSNCIEIKSIDDFNTHKNDRLVLEFLTGFGASKQLKKDMKVYEEKYGDKVTFAKIDTNTVVAKELAEKFEIPQDMPATAFLQEGKLKAKHAGVHFEANDQDIADGLSKLIPNSSAEQILKDVGVIDSDGNINPRMQYRGTLKTTEVEPPKELAKISPQELPKESIQPNQSQSELSYGQKFNELVSEMGRPGFPKVLHFSMEGCGPCKQLEPSLNKARDEFKDKIDVVDIDISDEKYKPLIDLLSVRSVPALLFVDKQGTLSNTMIGFDKGSDEIVQTKFAFLAKHKPESSDDLAVQQDRSVERFRDLFTGEKAKQARKIADVNEYMKALGRPGHYKIAEFYVDGHKVCNSAHHMLERLQKRYGEDIDFLRFDLNDPIGNKIAQKYFGGAAAKVIIVNDEGLYYTGFYSNDLQLEDRLRDSLKAISH